MSVECPTCGKSLNTERGMRQHHTKVHGDPLPNRECADCGFRFYDPKARRSYCDDCYSEAGAKNGNWQDATETATCEECGDEFEYYPSDKDGVYCPDCVEAADTFLGTHYAEVHDITPEQRVCEYCYRIFELLPCDVRDRAGRFCSQSCFQAWLADNRLEPVTAYKGDWFQVRRQALDRDHHRCQHCGLHAGDLGREPDVHHIVPIREFDAPQDAHTLSNVVALCRSCHLQVVHGTLSLSEIRSGS